MKTSLVIPAHNEQNNLTSLLERLITALEKEKVDYEVVVVDDNSSDRTGEIAEDFSSNNSNIRVLHRKWPRGFGRALKDGLRVAEGDIIVPVMGDSSDDPEDVIKLIKKAEEGHEIVYGSRFIKGGRTEGYPILKLFFNRCFNNLVRLLYGVEERDITNAFKAYRREVMEGVGVDNLESVDFDILIELPLKAKRLGFKSVEVPVTWHGRKKGTSKMRLLEMGPIYLKRLFVLKFFRTQ